MTSNLTIKKILFVFGTRPEAIKLAPLIQEFYQYKQFFKTQICITGQHQEMLNQVLDVFQIKVDFNLNIMKKNQDLFDITISILVDLKEILIHEKPDFVLVHGDTTSSLASALASFYLKIPIIHIEAGLRTNDKYNPWPEELNRQLITRITDIHFAPTQLAKENLLCENIAETNIFITGNTGIDGLRLIREKIQSNQKLQFEIKKSLFASGYDLKRLDQKKEMILITGHRRENFGDGFIQICESIKSLAEMYPNTDFVYPVHLNPNVQKPVYDLLANLSNVFLMEPLDYFAFVYLMSKCKLILTDSGGIQEEAPSFGKPVLVMREFTERPEAIEAGTAILVGSNSKKIVKSVKSLLDENDFYNKMKGAKNPFGDGFASSRIVQYMINFIQK